MACSLFLGHRFAFLLLTSASLVAIAAAAACGGDDTSAGDASDSGLIDSFFADTITDASVPTVDTPHLTFVNAAHDLGGAMGFGDTVNVTVRLCFGTGLSVQPTEIAPMNASPDVAMDRNVNALPGVDQGRGILLPDLALPYAARAIFPIVMSSRAIANSGTSSCTRLPSLLQEGVDYWVLPPIAPSTLQPKHAYVLALTGCSGNASTVNPGKCGPGFVQGRNDPLGNLAVRVFEPAPLPGAQFLYLSPAANAYFSQANERSRIAPGLDVESSGNGATFVPIASVDPPLFGLSPVTSTSLTDKQFVVLGRFALGTLASRLTDVALASGRKDVPYVTGNGYVFVAVGDPDTQETPLEVAITTDDAGDTTSGPNSRALHFLGFPVIP